MNSTNKTCLQLKIGATKQMYSSVYWLTSPVPQFTSFNSINRSNHIPPKVSTASAKNHALTYCSIPFWEQTAQLMWHEAQHINTHPLSKTHKPLFDLWWLIHGTASRTDSAEASLKICSEWLFVPPCQGNHMPKQNQEDSSTNMRPTKAQITTPSLMKDKMIDVQIMVTQGEKCMLYSGE